MECSGKTMPDPLEVIPWQSTHARNAERLLSCQTSVVVSRWRRRAPTHANRAGVPRLSRRCAVVRKCSRSSGLPGGSMWESNPPRAHCLYPSTALKAAGNTRIHLLPFTPCTLHYSQNAHAKSSAWRRWFLLYGGSNLCDSSPKKHSEFLPVEGVRDSVDAA